MERGFRVGSLAQDEVTGIKVLAITTTVANRFSTFECPLSTDYQVPAGKIFYITKITFSANVAGSDVRIGYGDDGVYDDAGGPTNAVGVTLGYFAIIAKEKYETEVFIPIPAQKYPYMYAIGGGMTVNIQGVEI